MARAQSHSVLRSYLKVYMLQQTVVQILSLCSRAHATCRTIATLGALARHLNLTGQGGANSRQLDSSKVYEDWNSAR